MRYFAHTKASVDAMLKHINKNSLGELFSSIPNQARLKNPLALPKPMDELALKRELAPFFWPSDYISFLGAGATEHFVPEWASQQLLRAEWYTSYTPYQPEASQGTLQAIFEFQSMVASLFGLEVANASMYDGATALVEALLMAIRSQGKRTVIISSTIHPEYRETIRTYFGAAQLPYIEIGFDDSGHTNIEELTLAIKDSHGDVAAIAVQSPNFFGRLEDIKKLAHLAHAENALLVGVITDMSCAGLVSSLGYQGADIAVGEGLGLLGGLSLGGPGVGLFACRRSLLRQMPGRLAGKTTDKNGRTGYVLTLSTREQHIRREKATSNICTNHNLMALAFSMTMAAYGRIGLAKLATTNVKKTLYLRRCLKQHGLEVAFKGPHYNETVINLGSVAQRRIAKAEQQHILAGLSLKKFYPTLDGYLLISTTELHQDHHIEELCKILGGVNDESA